ncbi:MAG: DUF362 domain-containing protein [Candidatus Aminicenantes bacterium]|nr:DUF362 domain-containing protein [Candidatus Aminicenantes bacterium]
MDTLSKVFIIKAQGVLSPDRKVNSSVVYKMIKLGLSQISKSSDSPTFDLNPGRNTGIKINTIGGFKLTTRPETALALAKNLEERGLKPNSIIIWDRTNRELIDAGYRLRNDRQQINIYGTDMSGVGYDREPTSHLNIGSLFSTIQSRHISNSISLALLKDHGLAGITAGMKNYYGVIHNPNKYHDFNCDPFVAELFDTDHIKKKHKLSILDCLEVQYHRGPALHPAWLDRQESLIFGLDPVAVDYAGWQLIERLRAKKGLPSLKEEKREPSYLKTAEKMGLGYANPNKIEIIEKEL